MSDVGHPLETRLFRRVFSFNLTHRRQRNAVQPTRENETQDKGNHMPATKQTTGPIASGTLYPLSTFKTLSGLSTAAMRAARLSGLKVKYIGKRCFVAGADFIAYVNANGRDVQRQLRKNGGVAND